MMEEEQRIKGNSITIILRTDGIIEIVDNEEWDKAETLETATEDTATLKKHIDGHDKALLVVVTSRYISKEILHHYQKFEFGDVARALIVSSFAAKVIGTLFMKLSKEKPNEAGRIVPLKLFTKKEVAEEWLLDELKKNQSI